MIHVDCAATSRGSGSANRPYWRITDALDNARLLRREATEGGPVPPLRLRHTGEVLDRTGADDDQELTHGETVQYNRQFINTTVGRVILNDHLPAEMPFINGLLKKKGIGQLVNYTYLRFGHIFFC